MLPIPTVTIARTELTEAASSVDLTVDLTGLPFESAGARHLVVSVNGIAEQVDQGGFINGVSFGEQN